MPKIEEPVQRLNGHITVPIRDVAIDHRDELREHTDFCERCGGFRTQTFIEAYEGEYSGELVPAWRCINCGDLADAQILANRLSTSGRRKPA